MHIKALNLANIVLTSATYLYAIFVFSTALDREHLLFGYSLLVVICIAYPLHTIVEIVALRTKKTIKSVDTNKSFAPQDPASTKPATVPTATACVDKDPFEALKRIKELYDMGVLTEEEFTAKKQQYIEQL